MDHGFTRAKEPWEMTDGCIYLLRELAKHPNKCGEVGNYVEQLSDIGYVDEFKHAPYLKENLFKSLGDIAISMKKKFQSDYVEMFAPILFKGINHQNQNTAVAAEDCL